MADGKEYTIDGVECVLETAIHGDLALFRAEQADQFGNVRFRHAQANFGPAMATASKLSIAEVRESFTNPMAPPEVQLSGVYVDRVVTAEALQP